MPQEFPFSRSLESIGDAFFATDKNWIVTYWNNMAERVLGKPKAEMLHNNLWSIFKDSVKSTSYAKYHEALATNEAVHFEDYYAPLEKWYEISAYPSENGLAVYFKDITERKKANERLKALNENLQQQFYYCLCLKIVENNNLILKIILPLNSHRACSCNPIAVFDRSHSWFKPVHLPDSVITLSHTFFHHPSFILRPSFVF